MSTEDEGGAGETAPAEEPRPPLLRIVSPDATPEQVAALVAVLSALGGGGGASAGAPVAEWSAPHRAVRRTVAPTRVTALAGTRGGWRSSGLPR